MPICRIPGPDGRPEYALLRDGKVCPLRKVMDAPPIDFDLFSMEPDELPSAAELGPELWSDAPDILLIPVPMPEKIF